MNGDELEDPGRSQARQALGRSRGGLTTKVHLAVDGRGLTLSIVLTPGNVNDSTAFGQVLDGIRTPRLGTGRPRTTPDRVLGDKAYSSRAVRHLLRRRGIAATIPERRDQGGPTR
ncbi:transposase [Streptomyces globisporus]